MQLLGQQSSKSFWDVAKLRKYMNLSFSTDACFDGIVIIFQIIIGDPERRRELNRT